jgi:hypothetical protein
VRAWVLVAAAGTVASVLAHRHCARPWLTRWGATDDEIARDLPGDELVDARGPRTTRAITIDAPPETVWAWLAQIGEDRAGFYSYSWLERLAGCRMHNAWSVHEEWQHREAGETVWLAQRYGELGRHVVARRLRRDRGGPARGRRVDVRGGAVVRRSHPTPGSGLRGCGGHTAVRHRALRDGAEDDARHQGPGGTGATGTRVKVNRYRRSSRIRGRAGSSTCGR